jgi:hypothetical protein
VEDRAAVLDTTVVASTDDLTVDHQRRADRDTTLGPADPRFLDRRIEATTIIAGEFGHQNS